MKLLDGKTLFPFQERDVMRMLDVKRCILGEPTGYGKTPISAGVIDMLWRHRLADRVVISVPKTILGQWKDRCHGYFGSWPHVADEGTTKQKRMRTYTRWEQGKDSPVLLVGHQRSRLDCRRISQAKPYVFALDEAQVIKNHKAKITAAMSAIASGIDYCFLISGSPAMNDLMELHSLMAVARPGMWAPYWPFRKRYCVEQEYTVPLAGRKTLLGTPVLQKVSKIVGVQNVSELKAQIEKYVIRDGDYAGLELPPVVLSPRMVELTAEQKHAYLTLRNTPIKPYPHAHDTRLLRLLQICDSLNMYYKNNRPFEHKSAKVNEVIRLAAEWSKQFPLLVYCAFVEVAHVVAETLRSRGVSANLLVRQMNAAQRRTMQDEFNAGKFDVLVFTPLGEYGLDLQSCNHLLMLDRQWNPSRNEQVIGRINRIGQTDTVFVTSVVAAGTADELVFRVLSRKVGSINEFMSSDLNELGVDAARQIVQVDMSGCHGSYGAAKLGISFSQAS